MTYKKPIKLKTDHSNDDTKLKQQSFGPVFTNKKETLGYSLRQKKKPHFPSYAAT